MERKEAEKLIDEYNAAFLSKGEKFNDYKIDYKNWSDGEIIKFAMPLLELRMTSSLPKREKIKKKILKMKAIAILSQIGIENPRNFPEKEILDMFENLETTKEQIEEINNRKKSKGSTKAGLNALKALIRFSKISSEHKKEGVLPYFTNLIKNFKTPKNEEVSLRKWYKMSVVPKNIPINTCDVLDFENYRNPWIFSTLKLAMSNIDNIIEDIEDLHDNYNVVISELKVSKNFDKEHDCDEKVQLTCPCKIVIFAVHDYFNNKLKGKMMNYITIEGELFT